MPFGHAGHPDLQIGVVAGRVAALSCDEGTAE